MTGMHDFDWAVMGWLNQLVGRYPVFDSVVRQGNEWYFYRSGWMVCILLWAWFTFKDVDSRLKIISGMVGLFVATAVSRAMQLFVFVHTRPFNHAQEFGLTLPANLDTHWGLRSSFPSDTATLYFALAAIIFTVLRRWGWVAFAWVAVVIALPRVYLTYHHASDIIAGAILGIGCVTLAQHYRHVTSGYPRVLRLETVAPQLFYPLVFVGLYQITDSFGAVEQGLHGVSRLMHVMRGVG